MLPISMSYDWVSNLNGIGWPLVPMASRPLASPFRMLVKTLNFSPPRV